MAIKNITASQTFVAGGTITENQLVKLDATTMQVVAAGAGEDAIGVAQNAAASGEEVSVAYRGVVKVVASAAIALGASLMAAATGKVVTATAPAAAYAASRVNVLGVALEAATANNDIISIFWRPIERT